MRQPFHSAHLLPCLAVLLFGCSSGKNNPEVTLEKANIQLSRGNFDDAVTIYTKAAEKLPERPELFFSRGLCYERLQLDEKAFEDYSTCLKMAPEHVDARNNSGVVLANLGRYTEAAQQFTILIEQSPNNVLALRNRGLCYHDLKKYDEALADYNRALEIDPEDAETWFQRGNVALERIKLAEAEGDFSKAIELQPEHSKAWMNRGVTRYQLGQMEVAMKDLEHARDLDANIVIPGINWLQTAPPAAEVVVAKPVLAPEAMADEWVSSVNFAIQHLIENGYGEIEIADELPEQRCGVLSVAKDDQKYEVVLAFAAIGDVDSVSIPGSATSTPKDEVSRILMVVSPGAVDESAAEGTKLAAFQVQHFQENWKPNASDIEPVVSRLKLTAK